MTTSSKLGKISASQRAARMLFAQRSKNGEFSQSRVKKSRVKNPSVKKPSVKKPIAKLKSQTFDGEMCYVVSVSLNGSWQIVGLFDALTDAKISAQALANRFEDQYRIELKHATTKFIQMLSARS